MPGVEVVGEASDGQELLDLLATLQPDVVLTDISMPRMDGITAIACIRAKYPALKVIALSMYDTVDFVRSAVASGACGYVMKYAAPAELESALRAVMATGSYFSAAVARLLMQTPAPVPSDELSVRQIEVLTMVAQGRSSKEIAFELGLSRKTVDVHRARIMDRLQMGDVATLTRYALRKGLVHA